jgi:hypothetical protein
MSSELPEWAEKEISSITDSSFKHIESYEGTGYFLDIDEQNRRADVQFYEKLPVGKHIVTLEMPKSIKMSDLMKGFVYGYKVNIMKAPLSSKLVTFLKENLNMDMDGVYKFELESLQLLDVESDLAPIAVEEDSED